MHKELYKKVKNKKQNTFVNTVIKSFTKYKVKCNTNKYLFLMYDLSIIFNFKVNLHFAPAAPVSPSDAVQTCRKPGPDSCSCLPHLTTPLLSWDPSQHHDVGPPGAPQNPEALEPELLASSTPTQALSCSLL